MPRLHVLTDDEVLARSDFLERASGVLAVGPSVALHLRGPGTEPRLLLELALRLGPAAAGGGGVLLVNDRIDVALAARANGVHLARRSLPARVARDLLPPSALLGASVHAPEAAREAAGGGADFLIVGTLFETPSHAHRPPDGIEGLLRVAAVVDRPLVGIGGVTPDRVEPVLEAGAWGVAVLRGVWSAEDPVEAVWGYLERVPPRAGMASNGRSRRG